MYDAAVEYNWAQSTCIATAEVLKIELYLKAYHG